LVTLMCAYREGDAYEKGRCSGGISVQGTRHLGGFPTRDGVWEWRDGFNSPSADRLTSDILAHLEGRAATSPYRVGKARGPTPG